MTQNLYIYIYRYRIDLYIYIFSEIFGDVRRMGEALKDGYTVIPSGDD